jgi:hypothetical protein
MFFIGMVYGNIDAMVLWANKQKSPPAFAKGDSIYSNTQRLLSVINHPCFADNGNLHLAGVGHFVLDFL